MALKLPTEGRMKAVASDYMHNVPEIRVYAIWKMTFTFIDQWTILFNCARHGNFYLETETFISGLREKKSGSVRVLEYLGTRRWFSFEVSIFPIISEKMLQRKWIK